MSEIKSRFEALQGATLRLRNSTAAERAAKLKALWDAIVDRQDDLYKAGAEERGVQPVDIAPRQMGQAAARQKHDVHPW